MKTAAEILKEERLKYYREVFRNEERTQEFVANAMTIQEDEQNIHSAMKEYAKQFIQEAAKRANLNMQYGYGHYDDYQKTGSADVTTKDKIERNFSGHGDSSYEIITVNKKSILNLLNEIK